jgi:hypothetical protein
MNRKVARSKSQKRFGKKDASKIISYRLKCAKTANGLSHFAMYGDVPKEQSLI